LLFGDRRLSFETLDFLWTIAPFSVRFCDFKPQSRSLSIHKDVEFHYVFEGEEIYILNGKEQRISKGELVCVNSYTPHNYYSLEKGRSVTVIVSADYLTKNGLFTTIRASRGEDIFAACGMLSTLKQENMNKQ
jgi:23S rRNA (adenine2503-C2)-methyltransferase